MPCLEIESKHSEKPEEVTPQFELQVLEKGNEIDNDLFEEEPKNPQVPLEQEEYEISEEQIT